MIKVFKIKDLIKYLIKILIVLTSVALVVKFINMNNNNLEINSAKNSETESKNIENNSSKNNLNKSKAWLFCCNLRF